MSDAYKIIHNFMAFIASPDLKNKVWTWLLDPSGKQRKEEALLQIWDEYRPEADRQLGCIPVPYSPECGFPVHRALFVI